MKDFSKRFKNIYFLSFIIPVILMLGIFIVRGIFPFGNNSFMFSDMYHQYIPFLTEFWHKLHSGESLAYSWYAGIGSNFVGIYAYYIASPINWLVFLCPENLIIEFMTYQIVIKLGLCGLTFSYYLSKRFETKDLRIVWFSIFYAMSGFIAAYSWNHMWMDGIWLTPLILLGLDELVIKRKCRLYCLTLTASIFTNYYLSILICIFLVIYFLVQLFTNGLTFRNKCRAILSFAMTSLLAGGMAGVLLYPVMNAMHVTEFRDVSFPKKIEFYFNILEMIARHVPMLPTERGLDHWPNIYCGVLAFVLVPIYFLHKKISLKQKVGKFILLAIFMLAFSMNILNFIWHGMNYPDSLPARQSFLYIFVILTMCFEAVYRNAENSWVNRIAGSIVGLILLAACGLFVYSDGLTVWVMACAWIFLAGYFILTLLFNRKIVKVLKHNYTLRRLKLYGKWVILALICTEAVLNMEETSVQPVQRDYYLNKKADYEALVAVAREEDDGFYRLDSLSQMTKNDGTLVGYPSASIFSSTVNGNVKDYYDSLGMGGSKVSYYYKGATPLASALLSVKYSFSEKSDLDPVLYEQITSHGSFYLYRNQYTLPIGFMLEKKSSMNLEEVLKEGIGNALIVQNKFVKKICRNQNLFSPLTGEEVISKENVITVTMADEGHIYGVVTSKPEGTVNLTIGDETIELKDVSNDYLLDMGRFTKGEQFILTSQENEYLKVQFYRLSDDVLKEAIQKLGETPFITEDFTANSLSGTISAKSDGYLIFSIPYENGWNIWVDGNQAEYEKFADTMIAIPLKEGTHSIQLHYTIHGWEVGLCCSIASILVFIYLYCIREGRKRKDS